MVLLRCQLTKAELGFLAGSGAPGSSQVCACGLPQCCLSEQGMHCILSIGTLVLLLTFLWFHV